MARQTAESAAIMRELAMGSAPRGDLKHRIFDAAGNVVADRPMPPEGRVDVNNMWMLLPGGPDRDRSSCGSIAGNVGDMKFGRAWLVDGNLQFAEGHSLYLLSMTPAKFFKLIDDKLTELGKNVADIQRDLAADVAAIRSPRPGFVYPNQKFDSLLQSLYMSLRRLGFSHRDLSKRLSQTL